VALIPDSEASTVAVGSEEAEPPDPSSSESPVQPPSAAVRTTASTETAMLLAWDLDVIRPLLDDAA
jgi:hypothetical protein